MRLCELIKILGRLSRCGVVCLAFGLILIAFSPLNNRADIPEPPDLSFKSLAAKKFTQTISDLAQGLTYLGGDPPKLVAVVPIGEVEQDGQILYKLKMVFRRVSRDRGDRKFPILKAKNYASAIAYFFHIDPGIAKTVATLAPKAFFGGRKFPTLNCEVEYYLYYKAAADSLFSFNFKPARRPHPTPKFRKKLIVENMIHALAPGDYQIKLTADASLDSSHPWVKFYNLVNWVLWAQAPVEVSLVSVLGTPDDLIIDTAKEVVSSSLLSTESITQFSVLSKVPKVIGTNRAVAQRELEKRSLVVQFESVYSPDANKAGKVKDVYPHEGEWLKAGSNVTLKHYALSGGPPEPQPTAAGPTDTYAAWIRPDRLTCCTSPSGVLTYAYQSGPLSSMPSNATLLQGGFASAADLVTWACGRPVYYHYWAKNWASINGYNVSQLPCEINS